VWLHVKLYSLTMQYCPKWTFKADNLVGISANHWWKPGRTRKSFFPLHKEPLFRGFPESLSTMLFCIPVLARVGRLHDNATEDSSRARTGTTWMLSRAQAALWRALILSESSRREVWLERKVRCVRECLHRCLFQTTFGHDSTSVPVLPREGCRMITKIIHVQKTPSHFL
jgi:hypothetical protein